MSLDFAIVLNQWPRILQALWYDLYFAAAGFLLGVVIGFVVNELGNSKIGAVKFAANAYVQLVRGFPMYLLLLWVYFGLASGAGIVLDGTQAIIIAIGLMSSAFTAEVFRAGFSALDPGQREAGQAMGLTGTQIMQHVLLPQVARVVIPPMLNVFIICFKAATYAAVIGVHELVFFAQDISLNQFRPFEAYITIAVVLIATVLALSTLVSFVERKLAIP